MFEAIGLTKHYGGEAPALDALDLRVDDGEIVALLGANGAGKTTTIQLFLGLTAPSAGVVRVDGLDVQEAPLEVKRRVAYLPERLALYPNFSGLENLAYVHGLTGAVTDEPALLGCLAEAGLDEAGARRLVTTYSKGMRQKVGIALAFAKQARSLLLDEPLSGLDPRAASDFCAALRRLRGQGAAVLMATHDLFRARETADRIGIMSRGKLVACVRPDEVSHADLEALYLERVS
jgi:ABC-2 type transport system ATP-binding protein